jgi:hypothetical protein
MKMNQSVPEKIPDLKEPEKFKVTRGLIILLIGCTSLFLVCTAPTLADTNQTIIIDPIGDHPTGEIFNITGTTTLADAKKIGIEIFQKKFWDSACTYAKEGDAGRIVFMEIASTKENFDPSGIKMVRFNQDGTQSLEIIDSPQDHWSAIVPVEKGEGEVKQWRVNVENNENGTPFSPGTYHVNVWDASKQVQHPGVSLGNGWNIITKKIYPSTARVNIWDKNNQKDMEYAEFTIQSS